ncbi:helix-turn-helix transcriptional regulator [Klebsiella aerogenes]|uniref:helix-turn-helix transcriptional regulator n=1 Tax=Klebsiella aerogenes TaxID=548 RepID=UPI0037543F8D
MLKVDDGNVSHQIIRQMIIWIESDLSRRMTVSEIGKMSRYTPWHFQKLFKFATGFSLMGYIRSRRMTVAAELLNSTELSVKAIYSQVGYTDGATFTRAFHRHFGITPTEFRCSDTRTSDKMVKSLLH